MPPITPAIIALFFERCNFVNLAKSYPSLLLFMLLLVIYVVIFYCRYLFFSGSFSLDTSITTINALTVDCVGDLCDFMLLNLTYSCQ